MRELKDRVTVRAEGVVEIRHPDLHLGAEAEVVIRLDASSEPLLPLSSFVGQAKGGFKDADEVLDFLRAERGAWNGERSG